MSLGTIRPPTPLDKLGHDELEAAMLDHPLSSLFDVSYTYAKLESLAKRAYVRSEERLVGVNPEYVPYMTDGSNSQVFAQSDAEGDHAGGANVVAARVHVTPDGNAELADPPIETVRLDKDDVYRLGYATLADKTSHNTVHSVTFHRSKSRKNPVEKVAAAVANQLTDWFDKDGVTLLQDDNEWNTPVLDRLATLRHNTGDDVDPVERTMKAVEETLDKGDIGPEGLFVTLKVQHPSESGWNYPGEVDELNEAMVRNRRTALKEGKSGTKGLDAYGKGRGLVTDEEETVYGGTGTPLATSPSKMFGLFDNMNPGSAHRTRPLTEDAALMLAKADEVIEAFRASLGFRQQLYLLPYYDRELTAEQARNMYAVLHRVRSNDDETPETAYISALEEYGDLSLYAAFITFEQSSVRHLQFEAPHIGTTSTRRLARAHGSVVGSRLLAENGPFGTAIKRRNEDDLFFARDEATLLRYLVRLGYFEETVPTPPYEDIDNPETLTEFPQYRLAFKILRGDGVEPDTLLNAYAERVVDYQRTAFGDREEEKQNLFAYDHENAPGVPRIVVKQFAQLRVLSRAGLLDGDHAYASDDTFDDLDSNIMTTDTDDDEPDVPERETKLRAFLKGHPVLDPQHEDAPEDAAERQSAFLFGALVGRLSAFQRHHLGVSSTLVERFPIDSMGKSNISNWVADTIDVNNTYSETESDATGLMNKRYIRRLYDVAQRDRVHDWDISESDLRFHYALGIGYGDDDWASGDDGDGGPEADDTEQTND